MMRRLSIPLLFALSACAVVAVWRVHYGHAPTAQQVEAAAVYARLPLAFEPNQGQAPEQVRYLARGPGYSVLLKPDAQVLSLHQGNKAAALTMRLPGANAQAKVSGESAQASHSNYFTGADPARWQHDLPQYARVRYAGIYPGIDLVYYGNPRQLEYDFVVAPGADPAQIRMRYEGADSLALNGAGDLVLKVPGGEVVHHKPVVYQDLGGRRTPRSGRYRLSGNEVAFALDAYDHTQPLVIDPALAYSSFLGGDELDQANAIVVDHNGYAYVAGYTTPNQYGSSFPVQSPYQRYDAGGGAFITKFNVAGNALVYSTFLGGAKSDGANALAVDAAGNAYLAGSTGSTDFPTVHPLQAALHGSSDAFIAKLNSAGNALVYSTYLGGTGYDTVSALAVDAAGNAYLAGYTYSTDFPTASPLQAANRGSQDGFVAKLNAAGSALVWSTYLGGAGADQAKALALDSAGSVYVVGSTSSSDFPVSSGAIQAAAGGKSDAFVVKFNAAGSALSYATHLGGADDDAANAITVDGAGNAYVAGSTLSADFPLASPLQPAIGSIHYADAFVARLNSAGNALVFSTYLGGEFGDEASAIALDAAGNIYLAGTTLSDNFPIVNSWQPANNSNYDAFIAKLTNNGAALAYSSYYGGTGEDHALALAVDDAGAATVVGWTNSTDLPTVNAFDPSYNGCVNCYIGGDAFIARFIDPTAGTVAFSNALYSVNENGGSATIAVVRSGGASGAIAVDYQTFDDTAASPGDYTAKSGTLIWKNGDTAAKFFTVPIVNDTTHEPNENLYLALLSPRGGVQLGAPSTAALGIVDDDAPPPPGSARFSSDSYTVAENAGSAIITVYRSGGSAGPLSVSYATANASATAGSDYTAASGTLSWAAGDAAPKSFSVPILNDAIHESTETVSLTLSGAAAGAPSSATLSITDDDCQTLFLLGGLICL